MAANSPITHLTVHCSSTKPSVFVDAKAIDRWHKEKGWLKIGYHFVILRDGTVQTGRLETEVGAHVEGHNVGNLGICLVGGLRESDGASEANYTPAQWAALETLLAQLKAKYPAADVLGHRDFPNVHKDCPCFDVLPWYAHLGARK